jgi:hypothetical protein
MATRDYSDKQEKVVAEYLEGTRTPNSGATPFKKGDIVTEDTIIECKTKTKEVTNHSIKKEWIDTLRRECISMGKEHWAIIFDFGTQKLEDQYVVLPISYYKELKEGYDNE